jgi:hypothetical protein
VRNNKLLEQARRRDPSPSGYELRQFSDLTPAEQAAYEKAPWLAWRHAPKDDIELPKARHAMRRCIHGNTPQFVS